MEAGAQGLVRVRVLLVTRCQAAGDLLVQLAGWGGEGDEGCEAAESGGAVGGLGAVRSCFVGLSQPNDTITSCSRLSGASAGEEEVGRERRPTLGRLSVVLRQSSWLRSVLALLSARCVPHLERPCP